MITATSWIAYVAIGFFAAVGLVVVSVALYIKYIAIPAWKRGADRNSV